MEDPKISILYRHLRFLLSIPSRTSVIQHRVYRNPRDTVKRYSNNLSDTCDSRRVGRHKKGTRRFFQNTIQIFDAQFTFTPQNDPDSNLFPANPDSCEEQGPRRPPTANSRTRAPKRSQDEDSAHRSADRRRSDIQRTSQHRSAGRTGSTADNHHRQDLDVGEPKNYRLIPTSLANP